MCKLHFVQRFWGFWYLRKTAEFSETLLWKSYLGMQIGSLSENPSPPKPNRAKYSLCTMNFRLDIIDLLDIMLLNVLNEFIYWMSNSVSGLSCMITFWICLCTKKFRFSKFPLNSLFTFTLSHHKNFSEAEKRNKFTLIFTFAVYFPVSFVIIWVICPSFHKSHLISGELTAHFIYCLQLIFNSHAEW